MQSRHLQRDGIRSKKRMHSCVILKIILKRCVNPVAINISIRCVKEIEKFFNGGLKMLWFLRNFPCIFVCMGVHLRLIVGIMSKNHRNDNGLSS